MHFDRRSATVLDGPARREDERSTSLDLKASSEAPFQPAFVLACKVKLHLIYFNRVLGMTSTSSRHELGRDSEANRLDLAGEE